MVKVLAALLLMACVVRVAGPATNCLPHRDILFTSPLHEDDNKAQELDGKEKAEHEQVSPESRLIFASYSGQLIKHPFELHQFLPARHDEPFCPPPNFSHS